LVQVLQISTRHYRRVSVVALRGELDIAGAIDLRNHLRAASKASNDRLILDLSELTFIDSTGLAILVEYHAKTQASGGRLILAGVQPPVARVLGISGLNGRLNTSERLDDAITTLEQTDRALPEEAEA
jgi:anti-sigma B factor antagonist